MPQAALPMKSYSTSVVGAITVAARASRKWRSTPTSLRNAAPLHTRIAKSVTSVAASPAAAWTAPIPPDHRLGVLLSGVVKAFVLDGWQIVEARVKPLLIVHGIDETAKLSLSIGEGLVLIEVHLLDSLNANDKTVAVARHG